MKNITQKIKPFVEQHGIFGLIRETWNRFLYRFLFRAEHQFVIDSIDIPEPDSQEPDDLYIRCFKSFDIISDTVMEQLGQDKMDSNKFHHHIQNIFDFGGHLWVVQLRGKSIGFASLFQDYSKDRQGGIPLTQGNALLNNAEIVQEFRGMGLQKHLIQSRIEEVTVHETQRFYSCVRTWNKPSVASLKKKKFVTLGKYLDCSWKKGKLVFWFSY